MKRGRLVLGLTLILASSATSLFADDVAQRLESIVVDTFDDPTSRTWLENGKEKKEDREWIAVGSKFATKGTPRTAYVDAWPAALFDTNPDKLPLKSLGVEGEFDRKGYNYIEIYPTQKDKDGNKVPYALPLPGIAKTIDLWIWGSYYKYYLEIHLRDSRGIPFVLEMGNLYFQGWKNLKVDVPSYIPQMQTYLPRYQGLTLTKLVLRTDPTERVSKFYVYIDQLKVLTDMHQNPFDGRELVRPDFINKYWSKDNGTTTSADSGQGK